MKKDYSIIENFLGCDFVVRLPESRGKGQVLDMQNATATISSFGGVTVVIEF